MKKKLRKQLNKILPNDRQVKESNPYFRIYPSESYSDLYQISFVTEPKQQKPEWIRITKRANSDISWYNEYIGHCFKVKKENIDDFDLVTNFDDPCTYYVLKTDCQPATPAEIEAHKLGFHVGDEVWINNVTYSKKLIIKEFHKFNDGISVITECGQKLWLSVLTKTPIFQIDGKDMFEGDEYFKISKYDNWILQKEITGISAPTRFDSWVFFTTKQDALNYVLEEAKRRFEGCEMIFTKNKRVFFDANICINNKEFVTCLSSSHGTVILWSKDEGWIAKPIKEQPLMLGEYPVEIKENIIHGEGGVVCENLGLIIKAKDGQVTKEEWMQWYPDFKEAAKLCTSFTMQLGDYEVEYFNDNKINFGCDAGIKRATISQIEAITKKLNKL